MGRADKRYTYVGFKDRIASITISTLPSSSAGRLVPHHAGSQPDSTFFSEAVERATDLDCTDAFTTVLSRLPSDSVRSFAQLLFCKSDVVDVLLEAIAEEELLPALQSTLTVFVALVRDLRDEFYPFCLRSLQVICARLLTIDPEMSEQLDAGFHAIAFMLRFCWKSALADVSLFVDAIRPILLSKREYLHRYAGEALAYLVRKMAPNFEALGKLCVAQLEAVENESMPRGVGYVLFETVAGVQQGYHSCAESLFETVFRSLEREANAQWAEAIASMADLCVEHVKKSTKSDRCLALDVALRVLKSDVKHDVLFGIVSKHAKLCDVARVREAVAVLLSVSEITDALLESVLAMLSYNVDKLTNEELITALECLLRATASADESFECLMDLVCSRLLTKPRFHQLKGEFAALLDERISAANGGGKSAALYALCRIIDHDATSTSKCFYREDDVQYSSSCFCNFVKYAKLSLQQLSTLKFDQMKDSDVATLIAILKILKIIGCTDRSITKHIQNILLICESASANKENVSIPCVSALCLINLDSLQSTRKASLITLFDNLLSNFPSDCYSLHFGSRWLILAERRIENLSIEDLSLKLAPNLSRNNQHVQTVTLEILQRLHKDSVYAPVLQRLLDVLDAPVDINNYKERIRRVHLLKSSLVREITGDQFDSLVHVVIRLLVAQLDINFSFYWPGLYEVIASYADLSQFWLVFDQQLSEAEESCRRRRNKDNYSEDSHDNSLERYLRARNTCAEARHSSHYEMQLWKSMTSFAPASEKNHKLVIPRVLRQLQLFSGRGNELAGTSTLDLTSGESGNDDESDKRQVLDVNLLIAMLDVCVRFRSPKSLSHGRELTAVYLDLLMSRMLDVQTAIFRVLFTYNYPYLKPYREHVERLLDAKELNDALLKITFHNGAETAEDDEEKEGVCRVDKAHQKDFIDIVFRFLHGRLAEYGRSTKTVHLAKQILRFVARCGGKEGFASNDAILGFTVQAFSRLRHLIGDDLSSCVALCSPPQYTIHAAIPVRFLLAISRHVGLITANLLSADDDRLTALLFRSCAVLAAIHHTLRAQQSEIADCFHSSLKSLRASVFERFTQFFKILPSYTLSSEHVVFIHNYVLFERPLPLGALKFISHITTEPYSTSQLLGYRDYGILKDVFACLSSNTPHVNDVVCNIAVHLLDLDEEVDGAALLARNADPLLEHICARLAKDAAAKDAKSGNWLRILRALASSSLDVKISIDRAKTLVSSLLRVCLPVKGGRKSLSEDVLLEILSTIQQIVGAAGSEGEASSIQKPVVERSSILDTECINALAKLFSTTSHRECRTMLCEILKFAEIPQTLLDIVRGLNAWNRKRVEEPDFDRRLVAFEQIPVHLAEIRSIDQAQLLIANLTYMISYSSDMTLREQSKNSLAHVLVHADAQVRPVIVSSVLSAIKRGIRSETENVRFAYIALLRAAVDVSTSKLLVGIEALTIDKTDPDLDFFANIVHLQAHRRARAMTRLAAALYTKKEDTSMEGESKLEDPQKMQEESTQKQVSQQGLVSFILPMASVYLTDPTYAKLTSVHDAAIQLIQAIASRLSWRRYVSLLQYYMTRLARAPGRSKHIARTVAAIVDVYHFGEKEGEGELENGSETASVFTADFTDMPTDPDLPTVASASNIETYVFDRLLPRMSSLISAKVDASAAITKLSQTSATVGDHKEDALRPAIATAYVKLLCHFDRPAIERALTNVIAKMCTFLRSRMYRMRQVARKTLGEVVLTLGVSYLPYVIRELNTTLTKGYQRHIRIFTIHHVLSGLAQANILEFGSLDSVTSDLLRICFDDFFSEMADEKEVDAIKRSCPEARASRAYHIFQLLTSCVSPSSLVVILEHLQTKLQHCAGGARDCTIIAKVCRFLQQGIMANDNLTPEDTTVLLHDILNTNTEVLTGSANYTAAPDDDSSSDDEEPQNDRLAVRPVSNPIVEPEPRRNDLTLAAPARTPQYVLVSFALDVISLQLKMHKFDSSNTTHQSILSTLVPRIVAALRSKHDGVVVAALRILHSVSPFQLPRLRVELPLIIRRLFILLHTHTTAASANSPHHLLVAIFKLLTLLIRDASLQCTISEDQLRVLLHCILNDLNTTARRKTAFTLLRSILHRQLQCDELNDCVSTVRELILTSPSDVTRLQARQVLHFYILHYPLGPDVVTDHVHFLLAQLDYEEEMGRQSVLESLAEIMKQLPQELLDTVAPLAFVQLSARLLVDPAPKCRKLVTAVLSNALLAKVSESTWCELFEFTRTWLADGRKDATQLQLAVQLNTVFAATQECENYYYPRLQIVLNELHEYFESDDPEFHVVLLKFLRQIISREQQTYSAEVQMELLQALEFAKEKLRKSSVDARRESLSVFLSFLSNSNAKQLLHEFIHDSPVLLCDLFVAQLRRKTLDDQFAQLATKCILSLLKLYPNDITLLKSLFESLVRVCRLETAKSPKQTTKRIWCFKCIGALALNYDRGIFEDLLPIILPPIHRELELSSQAPMEEHEENTLPVITQEVATVIKERVGDEMFAGALVQCQKAMIEKRLQRKRAQQSLLITDTAAAARRKEKKNKAKVEGRKRRKREQLDGVPRKRIKSLVHD